MFSLKAFLPGVHFNSFLVISIGYDAVKAAVFNSKSLKIEGVGRSSRDTSLVNSVRNAIEALAAVISRLPDETIIGIMDDSLYARSHALKKERAEERTKISFEEIDDLVSSNLDSGGGKLFFSTIAISRIDGIFAENPIGAAGRVLDLEVFNAYLSPSHLSELDQFVADLNLKVTKVLPSSFTLQKLLSPQIDQNCAIIYLGKENTEITRSAKGIVESISTLALKSESDFWTPALEAAFQKEASGFHAIYLWGEADLDKAKARLEKVEAFADKKIEFLSLEKLGLATEFDLAGISQEFKADLE